MNKLIRSGLGCGRYKTCFFFQQFLATKTIDARIEIMKVLGAWMIAWGILSLAFGFVGWHFNFLCFLDAFGPTMAYVLKVGFVAAGIRVWRRDTVLSDETEREEENPRSWIPVDLSGVAFSTIRNPALEHRINRPRPSPPVAAAPTVRKSGCAMPTATWWCWPSPDGSADGN